MSEQPPSPPAPAAEASASAPPPGVPAARAGADIPLDADDTRGRHFGALARHPATLVGEGLPVAATAIVLALAVGPLIGLAGALGAFLVVLVIVWALASGRAESDFFKAYATGRSLTLEDGRGSLPPMPPLLRRGDKRYTKRKLSGTLPGGEQGTLAHYTYGS